MPTLLTLLEVLPGHPELGDQAPTLMGNLAIMLFIPSAIAVVILLFAMGPTWLRGDRPGTEIERG